MPSLPRDGPALVKSEGWDEENDEGYEQGDKEGFESRMSKRCKDSLTDV